MVYVAVFGRNECNIYYYLDMVSEWLRNGNQKESQEESRAQKCFALAHLEIKQPTRHVYP